MEGLGDRIRFLLEQNEMSQKEFAARISSSPTAVNNYIQDYRMPPLETLTKICDVLHCSADYLLGRKEEPLLRLSDEEQQLLRAWRKTEDPDLKALIMRNLGIVPQKKKKAI